MHQDALIIKQLSYQHSGQVILDQANLTWPIPSKTALIGANGAGKTTLLNLLMGNLTPDNGEIIWPNHILIKYLAQKPNLNPNDSILTATLRGLGADGNHVSDWLLNPEAPGAHEHLAHINEQDLIQQAKDICRICLLDATQPVNTLSEGLKRRVAFAQTIINKPDVLILDEPTNHLDIAAIEWLTQWCQQFTGSIILVSHDRQLIDDVANRIVEIDHGQLMGWPGQYADHQARKQAYLAQEAQVTAKMDKKIAAEMHWLARGVTARRKRNQGRLEALHLLKEQRAQRNQRKHTLTLQSDDQVAASKKLIQLKQVSFGYRDDACIIKPLSFTLTKGDHVGIIGRNGCGKSTLIQLMLKQLTPTSGEVIHAPNLKVAYFDQKQDQLNPKKSLVENIAGGQTHVDINGGRQHVVSYLQNFLFESERLHVPIEQFSGGEKQRALLAKLLLKEANLYILDEPTNDLDLDTLDALSQFLVQTQSAVLLVSHDRAFINAVATNVLVFEHHGEVIDYAGGYEDACAQGAKPFTSQTPSSEPSKPTQPNKKPTDHRAIRRVLDKIQKLETTIATLTDSLNDEAIYLDHNKVREVQQQIKAEEAKLEEAFMLWSSLEGDTED